MDRFFVIKPLVVFSSWQKVFSVSMQMLMTSEEESISFPHLFLFSSENDRFFSASSLEQINAPKQVSQSIFFWIERTTNPAM